MILQLSVCSSCFHIPRLRSDKIRLLRIFIECVGADDWVYATVAYLFHLRLCTVGGASGCPIPGPWCANPENIWTYRGIPYGLIRDSPQASPSCVSDYLQTTVFSKPILHEQQDTAPWC